MADMDELVVPFDKARLKQRELMGGSRHVDYILGYLGEIKALACVFEREYIDKDFTIDYQKFYCRSFNEPTNKNTKRFHFFANSFDSKQFLDYLRSGKTDELRNSYLGFSVIRPINDALGHPLVGRTVLKTYPQAEGDSIKRIFIKSKEEVSLFGIPLTLDAVPYQAQDCGVSACATVALWSCIHPLKDIFGVMNHSPAEITEMATSLPSFHRRFPTTGLTKEQIINFVKLLGLDVEIIKPKSSDSIPIIIKAYINAGLPILASLTLKKKTQELSQDPTESEVLPKKSRLLIGDEDVEQRHAVLITGYQIDKEGSIKKLYVHDDEIGPYCKVNPLNGNFLLWQYELAIRNEVKLEDLEVPIYPKVRTTFPRILAEYLGAIDKDEEELRKEYKSQLKTHFARRGKEMNEKRIEDTISRLLLSHNYELFLTSVKKYKETLLSDTNIDNKIEILMKPLPKYLWVIRKTYKNNPERDYIYDTTTVYATQMGKIKYIKNNID
jgi:hypothetical protein